MEFSRSFEFFLYGILAILPIANPITSVPIFLAQTPEDDAVRKRVAWQTGRNVFLVLSVSLILGSLILDLFQISIPALRSAGGLVVILIGIRMLFEETNPTPASLEGRMWVSPAFVPLTIPSVAGPGSLSIVMEGATRVQKLGTVPEVVSGYLAGFLVIAVLGLSTWLTFRFAVPIARKLGVDGLDSVKKISGFLFICIGMQLISVGIFGFIEKNRPIPPGQQLRAASVPEAFEPTAAEASRHHGVAARTGQRARFAMPDDPGILQRVALFPQGGEPLDGSFR